MQAFFLHQPPMRQQYQLSILESAKLDFLQRWQFRFNFDVKFYGMYHTEIWNLAKTFPIVNLYSRFFE